MIHDSYSEGYVSAASYVFLYNGSNLEPYSPNASSRDCHTVTRMEATIKQEID